MICSLYDRGNGQSQDVAAAEQSRMAWLRGEIGRLKREEAMLDQQSQSVSDSLKSMSENERSKRYSL